MKLRQWLLPVFAALAVLLAVLLPQVFLLRWDQKYLDVVQEEPIDEDTLVVSYTLNGADRMHLLRYSGIRAQNGGIEYGSAGEGISLEVKTLEQESLEDGQSAAGDTESTDPALLHGSVGEYIYNYLYDGLYYLVEYNIINNDVLLHYQQSESTLSVDYCTVTDSSDPFFSMALLCISVELEDGEAYGLAENTEFSVVLDEETGVIYALSLRGEPALTLTENPLQYALLADLIGVSFTEYEEFSEGGTAYPSARFNFGGYSYVLFQQVQGGVGTLNFNPESR